MIREAEYIADYEREKDTTAMRQLISEMKKDIHTLILMIDSEDTLNSSTTLKFQ
jgi:phosphopantetheine adenylyltransferase